MSFMRQKYLQANRLLLTILKESYDIYHPRAKAWPVILISMMFSKSFGYALRSVLYVAIRNENVAKVQLEEIALKLGLPRHFLGKVMKNLVKEGVISSQKGPAGGFYSNARTKDTSLFTLVEVTGEVEEFGNCVLRFRKCNASKPCPLHGQMETLRNQWQRLLSSTTIGDLINREQPDFIRSITAL